MPRPHLPASKVETGIRRTPHDGTPKKRGRPPGSRDKAKIAREERLAAAMRTATKQLGAAVIDMMDPLDVLVFAMRLIAKQGQWFKAAELAGMAAPYVHPKLQSIVQRNFGASDFDLAKMSDDDLYARLSWLQRQIDAEPVADAAEPKVLRRANGAR